LLVLAKTAPAATDFLGDAFDPVAQVVTRHIRAGALSGAVVLVGHEDRVVYRRAFGHRTPGAHVERMTTDTIFDLASLTKPIATATAVLQLVENEKLGLDDPIAKHWPGFGTHGKERITVRDLLTHHSGLRADLDLSRPWSGYSTALKLVAAEQPLAPPGTRFVYSDVGFLALGELVRRVSGLPLDEYCAHWIFGPLGMKETAFRPPLTWRGRIAPTSYPRGARGEVHDPTAARAAGVAGHAGLFSTADDLARFSRMMLDGGALEGRRILASETVRLMTSPQTPPGQRVIRGLGWDIDSPYSVRGDLFPVGSYGHTGFTGTSVWIDAASRTYLVVLAANADPSAKAGIRSLRNELATIVARAVGTARTSSQGPSPRNPSSPAPGEPSVRSGIDVLRSRNFAPVRGQRIGLVTNHSGMDSRGRRTIDVLQRAVGIDLVAILSPEHGLNGDRDGKVPSSSDPASGLPVYSLYGDVKRPSDSMLKGLDALVFDVQDAGARFYTYITTLGYVLEAAARRDLGVYVLDRPNPIGAERIQGPLLDPGLESFTGYFPLPVQHGMTVGELARLFNREKQIGARLTVIPMQGYRRSMWYDETGLPWVHPSPNLRSLTGALLYPGVALMEGANVSVGRGTDTPFELVGAPWVDGKRLAAYLDGRRIPGVSFAPAMFIPRDSTYRDQKCQGIRIFLTDRQALDAPALGIEIIGALWRHHADRFALARTLPLVGSRAVLESIRQGRDPRAIADEWGESLAEFRRLREQYLVY
jgi:uncharacterized protein YbbC (DUF1343 family)/CubicO group peptidase (beta-lactamase class C family)